MVVDPRGVVATVNQAAVGLLGLPEEELVGQLLSKFLAPRENDPETLRAELEVLRCSLDQSCGADQQRLMSELSILPVGMTYEVAGTRDIWLNESLERLTGWDKSTFRANTLLGFDSLGRAEDEIGSWPVRPIALPCANGATISIHRVRLPMTSQPGCVFGLYLSEHELRSWPVLNHLILQTMRPFNGQAVGVGQLEIDLMTAEGNTVPVLLAGAKILGQSMEHEGTVLVVKDMTSIRRSEQEREQIKLQLFAQSKLAGLGQVAAGVAHEINNPLTLIKAYLRILESDLEQAELVSSRGLELLPEASRQVERIRKIVRHMQPVGREDPQGWVHANLGEILDDSLVLLQDRITANRIQIRREIEPELPTIECSPDSLEQLMTNLLQNSVDSLESMGPERTVVVHMRANDDETVGLEFRDNGEGIEASDLERISDPFFTTKEVGKGTGLGLSLSYAIAREHRGGLECDSKPGQGTTMSITLPIRQSSKTADSSKPVRHDILAAKSDASRSVTNEHELEPWSDADG